MSDHERNGETSKVNFNNVHETTRSDSQAQRLSKTQVMINNFC